MPFFSILAKGNAPFLTLPALDSVFNVPFLRLIFYGHGMPCPYEWVNRVFCFLLPPMQGRKGSLEKVLNILSCPLRGAIPIATRGQAGVGPPLYII